MGLFDKVKQMKADHDARKAAEAAELQALCDRLRRNGIFLNYADRVYDALNNPADEIVQWASGKSAEQQARGLALVLTPDEFGLVRTFFFDRQYRGSDGKLQRMPVSTYEPVDVQHFADYGMQSLPNHPAVKTAVLETLASRLGEIPYLTAAQGNVTDTSGEKTVRFDAMRIQVSRSGLQSKRTAW